jgi:hypothetical protein
MVKQVLDWLLEPYNPSIKYRTNIELLEKKLSDQETLKNKTKISKSSPVQILLEKMHPDGYWLQKNPRTKEVLGDGVKYGSFVTTHYYLSYLAELGIDKRDKQVAKAAERYLSLQKSDGDFLRHYSCLLAYNIRTFLLLGYREDPRLQRSINLLLSTDRHDGGYLCDMHEGKYKTKPTKSCIRGSVKALLAFSLLPEYWEHERCLKLVNYFLRRGGIYKSTDPSLFANKDMERNSFPITWRANVFEILYSLSRMGYGNDERLEKAWRHLESKRDEHGRYYLDWTPSQSPWKVGGRGEPNKWITFYSLLAHKYAQG